MKVKGEAALITGGGSGLGAETARLLASQGAKVALLDVNMEGAEAVAKETGGVAVECDVTSAESGEAAVAKAREAHGPARILVNCAGVAPAKRVVGRDGPCPLDHFEKGVAINLTGTFNMIRLAAADMTGMEELADGERGVIVNTASIASVEGQVGQAAYAASKAGVKGMMLPIAREFTRFGIRVMTIAPGLFETPMLLGMPQEVQDNLAAQVPFPKRLGKPDEYARTVLHICENVYLNADTIRLDGAMRMQ